MKGMVDTKDVLKPLVKKENGLHTGRAMSVFTYNEVPQMDKMLGQADGGMIPYPTLEQKRDIIITGVESRISWELNIRPLPYLRRLKR